MPVGTACMVYCVFLQKDLSICYTTSEQSHIEDGSSYGMKHTELEPKRLHPELLTIPSRSLWTPHPDR